MFAQQATRGIAIASVLALTSCATPFAQTPPLCQATMDVARHVGDAEVGVVSFVEQGGVVSCQADAGSTAICAAYESSPPGSDLASVGVALRSCLYGHGYIRRVDRREVRGATIISAIRGGFRFSTVVVLQLDDEGRRYDLELQERIILTERDSAARL